MSNPSAIIFDFDGVIVNSLSFHLTAWEKSFFFIFKRTICETQLENLVGKSTSSIAKILLHGQFSPHLCALLIKQKEMFLLQDCIDIPFFSKAFDLFDYCATMHIPYAIVSNSPKEYLDKILIHNGFSNLLSFGIENFKHPKPSPEPFLLCAKALKIHFLDHNRLFVLDDSFSNMRGIRKAGMIPIGITTQQDKNLLMHAGAQLTFKDIAEFYDYLAAGGYSPLANYPPAAKQNDRH